MKHPRSLPSAPNRLPSTRARFHPRCVVCSPEHPLGLAQEYILQPDGSVEATFVGSERFEGYSGLLHGGMTAALLDGAMTNRLFARGVQALTAELTVRYRHPVAVCSEMTTRACLAESRFLLFFSSAPSHWTALTFNIPMNSKDTSLQSPLRIAIPVANGRLHGHFGGCTLFAIVEADRERKTVLSTRTAEPPPHAPGVFPRWLHEQGVRVVLTGGIGRGALDLFAQQGIEVRSGPVGATVEELVTSYLSGALTGAPQGCASHGQHHQHEHGGCHHH